MSVATFIERMRTRQADLFDTTVTVTRKSATGTFNPATATYAAPTATQIYTGPALVRPQPDQIVAAGEVTLDVSHFVVKLPADTTVEVGDNIAVTASTHDAGLVGLGFRVIEVANDEWQICRRATCVQETVRPT